MIVLKLKRLKFFGSRLRGRHSGWLTSYGQSRRARKKGAIGQASKSGTQGPRKPSRLAEHWSKPRGRNKTKRLSEKRNDRVISRSPKTRSKGGLSTRMKLLTQESRTGGTIGPDDRVESRPSRAIQGKQVGTQTTEKKQNLTAIKKKFITTKTR